MGSDVLLFRGEPIRNGDGIVLTVRDYEDRFFELEGELLALYEDRGVDSSAVVLVDSENDDGGFLWPVFAVDEVRDSQGVCDLFSGSVEGQALFLFEQLMELY